MDPGANRIGLERYYSTTTAVSRDDNDLSRDLTAAYEKQFDRASDNDFFELEAGRTVDDDFIDRAKKDLAGVDLHRPVGVTFNGSKTNVSGF